MGCAASKLDNEDTVRRCKERRRLIKEAVYARHHLAAAHADYCCSLRNTGSALCSFAAGESLSVSEQTPAVFVHNTTPPPPPSSNPTPPRVPPSPSPSPSLHEAPPPPLSPSVASSKLPPVKLNRRRKPAPKLPHILSESSPSTSPRSERSNYTENHGFPTAYQANSTYSNTPSQASSVWNWENFYPPSPPDSEFFDKLKKSSSSFSSNYQHHERENQDANSSFDKLKKSYSSNQQRQNHLHKNYYQQQGGYDDTDSTTDYPETETEKSEYDYFNNHHYPRQQQQQIVTKKYKNEENVNGFNDKRYYNDNDNEEQREEVQCSEWEDHDRCSTTSSSDMEEEEEEEEDVASRSEIGARSTVKEEGAAVKEPVGAMREDGAGSSASFRTGGGGDIGERRMVVRHKDLKEIVGAIKENFDKAAAAGDQVAEMLEIGRAQLDRSFRQLKKTVYHSSSILSNLSSSWTSKPPLAVKYRFDTGSLNEPGGLRSLCSTMERLLAWEKKLYADVKTREGVKIEHEKKLSTLQSQEYKGEDEAKLDKTKTAIKSLQSQIQVMSEAVDTTSAAIINLRNSDLVPQLVELCHGFMYMWRSMYQFHEVQNNIVEQVRGLVNRSAKGDSTSELHRQATRELESAVSAWHSSFCRLMKFQRDFIQSVHGWFSLTLIPVTNSNVNGNMVASSDAYGFCDEWKLALERVPDTVASEAIKSFINVVHAISIKQTEEIKIKKRTETASKELERKASSLRNIERKFYHSYSMVGIGLPDTGPDNGHALDARDPLAEKKSELAACQRRVEDEMLRHGKAVEVTREMTLNNLRTGLPGVFQALTNFSSLFTTALESVCNRSYAIK